MRRKLLPAVAAVLLLAAHSPAEQVEFQHVGEMVKLSDLIARVKIVSVRETGAKEGYAKIASVQIAEAFKGGGKGKFFDLEFEAVNFGVPVSCPNVSYAEGEDVLLFARRLPNGNYHTLYADAGRFLISEGRLGKRPFRKGQDYESAVAEVRREVKRLEGLAVSKR
ncbi:MAG TPA: hypothetical protein VK421_08685 [Pyrinomonadaceae bacterium]|nr:hypothetical protein [Pyrinomonadaceae bacterium]